MLNCTKKIDNIFLMIIKVRYVIKITKYIVDTDTIL